MQSLRARLLTAFVAPTIAIVLMLVAVAYLTARQGMEAELTRRLESVGQTLASEMSEGIDAAQLSRLDENMPRVRSRLQERLEAAQTATELERIFIFDAEAHSLVDTEEHSRFGEPLFRVQADRGEWSKSFSEGSTAASPLFQDEEGSYHKTAYVPIFLDGEVVAVIGTVASATYFDLLTGFATVLTLLGALGVLAVVLIGLWFSAVLMGPVDALVEAAGRLARGDLKTSVTKDPERGLSSTRELDFLLQSFEEMRLAIVARDEQMQLMLAGIAHEVRNPLGGIELFCGLLKEEVGSMEEGKERERRLKMVGRIEREVAYLGRVVEDFLAFAGPQRLQVERLAGDEFFEEIKQVVASTVLESGCEFALQLEPGLELTVDPGKMRRAVINVVRNACEASVAGTPIAVYCRKQGAERVIEIVDQGAGIEAAELERLCKPFYTTREKGSGLGLSLTRQIVEDHGGRLEIESVVGEGTTLRFVLPFDESIARREAEEAASLPIPEGWLG